jgi:hypothetical protein
VTNRGAVRFEAEAFVFEKGSGRFVITSIEPLPGKFMAEVPAGSQSEQTLLRILSEQEQGAEP